MEITQGMEGIKRHIFAGILGVLLLLVMLGIITIDDFRDFEPPEQVAVRNVEIYEPPPPPPPPVQREDQATPDAPDLNPLVMDINMDLGGTGIAVNISGASLGGGPSGFGEEVNVDFGNVDLSELDSTPMLLNSPQFDDARSDEEKRAVPLIMDLHFLIDEEGRAHLIEVLQWTYAANMSDVEDFVSELRYTPPTLLGQPVRTEYTQRFSFALEEEE